MPAADTASTRTVGDIMSTPVVVAAPDDKVAEAAARMREQRVGSVVVVDESRPVGILTERDLVRIAAASLPEPGSVRPHADSFSPLARGTRYFCFCSAVQNIAMCAAPSPLCAATDNDTLGQTRAISSMQMQ